ncbi:MAG: RidA family protein [Ignavibacteria bacterium]|jgi:enamine deaminase RidA (YjgF/YER057c/UK114 family)
MAERKKISSGAVWEDIVGYSRAVKIGNVIEISGTTAVEGEKIIGIGDPYLQTENIINKFKNVLEIAGSSLDDIVRVRMYVTNMDDWEVISKAFSKYFRSIKPAATLVGVKSLINPDLLVEIEATAIISDKG